ncbi:hypothetical protein LshimejAT787_0305190 [Lyophyllum shimeji]|uniref:Altered inheritance of mitochondria protein 6 n=1 Tax=Lyophyllum shimeji TaxID=47721 RepID=A0A9P3PI66_LYOSH|nr:hypothetical protein LshimejAT787_0305190 [Lyophyllum shimeji]
MPSLVQCYDVLLDFTNDTLDCVTVQLLHDYGRNTRSVVLLHPQESVTLVLDAGSVYRYAVKTRTKVTSVSARSPLIQVTHQPLTAYVWTAIGEIIDFLSGTMHRWGSRAHEPPTLTSSRHYKDVHDNGRHKLLHFKHPTHPFCTTPTQLTQGIVPKQIHSHNDYWRDVPLLTALSFGVASVEADVWLVDGELLQQNTVNVFTVNQTQPNGVFDTPGGTPLQLLVDMKTDGVATLPLVLKALEPLRAARYTTASQAVVTHVDYEVSVGWNGIEDITEARRASITRLVGAAHGLGIKARFWNTPGWPIEARNNVWKELLNDGADWLNADDLEAASSF